MTSKGIRTLPSIHSSRLNVLLPTSRRLARQFIRTSLAHPHFAPPPLGRLTDPHLLDRLQAPLTRFHD